MPPPPPREPVDPAILEATRQFERQIPSRRLRTPYPGLTVVIDGPAMYEGCNGGTHYHPRFKVKVQCHKCNDGFAETNIMVVGDDDEDNKSMKIYGVNHLSYESTGHMYLWPCDTESEYKPSILEEWNNKFKPGTELTFKTLPTVEHALNQTWSIWEHRDVRFNKSNLTAEKKKELWDNAAFRLCDFSTVESFWKYFQAIPGPGQIFFNAETRKKPKLRGRPLQLNAFSVFKEGIKPDWDDKRVGGFFYMKRPLSTLLLNDLWEALVLGTIGESFDSGDNIVGCRTQDKSVDGRNAMYRLEIWVRGSDKEDPGLKKVGMIVTECIKAILKRYNERTNSNVNTDIKLEFQVC